MSSERIATVRTFLRAAGGVGLREGRDLVPGERARAFLRAANGLGSLAAEDLWAWGSGAAGRRLTPMLSSRGCVSRWASTGRERVVAVAPHPDDEAMGCAGTLIRHSASGDTTRIVFVTDGSRSRALGLDRAAMRARRQREALEAAAHMGAACVWLGLPEHDWSDAEGRAALRRAFADFEPTIVYAPSAIDYHPEHRRVARAVADALCERRSTAEVRLYAIQVPLTPLLTNLIHDVSDLETSIHSALTCYATQRMNVMRTLRLRRYAARFWRASAQVEAFCAIPVATYAQLHRRAPARFRPLWNRSWTDPLALAAGFRERISWSRALSHRSPLQAPEQGR